MEILWFCLFCLFCFVCGFFAEAYPLLPAVATPLRYLNVVARVLVSHTVGRPRCVGVGRASSWDGPKRGRALVALMVPMPCCLDSAKGADGQADWGGGGREAHLCQRPVCALDRSGGQCAKVSRFKEFCFPRTVMWAGAVWRLMPARGGVSLIAWPKSAFESFQCWPWAGRLLNLRGLYRCV